MTGQSIHSKLKNTVKMNQETIKVAGFYYNDKLNLKEIADKMNRSITWVISVLNKVTDLQRKK